MRSRSTHELLRRIRLHGELDVGPAVGRGLSLVALPFVHEQVGLIAFAAHQLGAGIAAWGAGAVRDAVGDYAVAFYAAGIVAGGMVLLIRRAPGAAVRPAAA